MLFLLDMIDTLLQLCISNSIIKIILWLLHEYGIENILSYPASVPASELELNMLELEEQKLLLSWSTVTTAAGYPQLNICTAVANVLNCTAIIDPSKIVKKLTIIERMGDILFDYNVQHDCYTAKCSAGGQESIRQEQAETDATYDATVHKSFDQYVLNTHLLHNAYLV
ncbi:hypothetical protein AN958_00360 [Leucoagaricus sp. SymC.cos]|nr:hypothetical protein AN958_00360 [Leucoagaricus sp. SymC.cos]